MITSAVVELIGTGQVWLCVPCGLSTEDSETGRARFEARLGYPIFFSH